jgi:hypothetical protein
LGLRREEKKRFNDDVIERKAGKHKVQDFEPDYQ